MVFTANQIEEFFLQEMKVPRETWVAMQSMGISDVDSLKDYTKDLLEHLRSDLRRPSGTMQDPNDATRLIPRTPYVLSPVSFHRLYVASEAVRYYAEVGRPLTAANMRWQGPLTAFEMYLKARTEEEKNQESLVVPVISKSNPIFQWSESWSIYLDAKLGYRKIPLAYIVRPVSNPPVNPPALMTNRPYSEEHGSVANELIARADHNHGLFAQDNSMLFDDLAAATVGTVYAATIAPFKKKKDGKGAQEALFSQHLGKDKWDADIKKQESYLHTFVWKGNSNQTLESFVNKHRIAFTRLQQCAEHVMYTLPNERQRVKYLLDGIQSDDARLLAAIGSVQDDDAKLGDFEKAAAKIIPADPVKNKRGTGSNKRKAQELQIGAVDLQSRGSKTGVEFRFYKPHEYRNLTKEQKDELKEMRKLKKKIKAEKEAAEANKPNKKAKLDKKQVSRIAKTVVAALNAEESKSNDDDDEAKLVIGALNDMKKEALEKSENDTSTKVADNRTLKSILIRK